MKPQKVAVRYTLSASTARDLSEDHWDERLSESALAERILARWALRPPRAWELAAEVVVMSPRMKQKKLYLNTNTRDIVDRLSDETGLPRSLLVDGALQNGLRQRRDEAAGMLRRYDRAITEDHRLVSEQIHKLIKRCAELATISRRLDELVRSAKAARDGGGHVAPAWVKFGNTGSFTLNQMLSPTRWVFVPSIQIPRSE